MSASMMLYVVWLVLLERKQPKLQAERIRSDQVCWICVFLTCHFLRFSLWNCCAWSAKRQGSEVYQRSCIHDGWTDLKVEFACVLKAFSQDVLRNSDMLCWCIFGDFLEILRACFLPYILSTVHNLPICPFTHFSPLSFGRFRTSGTSPGWHTCGGHSRDEAAPYGQAFWWFCLQNGECLVHHSWGSRLLMERLGSISSPLMKATA